MATQDLGYCLATSSSIKQSFSYVLVAYLFWSDIDQSGHAIRVEDNQHFIDFVWLNCHTICFQNFNVWWNNEFVFLVFNERDHKFNTCLVYS